MSVRILLSDLTHEQKNCIRQHLYMQPKETYYRGGPFSAPTSSEPILFYRSNDEYVDLPIAFASGLLQTNCNSSNNHLAVNLEFNPERSLYENQLEVYQTALGSLITYGTVHLGLHTGFGKTIIATKLACDFKLLTVVFLHRTPLIRSWVKVFTTFANGVVWIVGEKFPTLQPGQFISVIICMGGRYLNIPKEYLDAIGTVIVDESHNFCTPSNSGVLLACHPRHFISCSATLKRPDGMETMIQSIVGNNEINRYSSNPFEYYRVNTNITVQTKLNKQGKTDFNALVNDLCEVEARNRLIFYLVQNQLDRKILVMTARVSHAKYLYDCFKMLGESVDYMAGPKQLYTDSRILVATYSKLGEGFDEENFCPDYNGIHLNTLILCSTFKSERMLLQVLGRVFRTKMPRVFDLVDKVDLIWKRHYPARRKVVLEINGIVKTIEVVWSGDQIHSLKLMN